MGAMTSLSPPQPVPGFPDLRSRICAGEILYGTFLQLGSAIAAEIVARAGLDWVIVDLEHGAGTEADLPGSLVAVSTTSTAALVRPQSAERVRIGRALDHGAHGLMVPRIDDANQAREAISFMRFPPDGVRGLALSTRGAGLGERGHADVAGINRQIVGIIQIESPSAVEHAAEIAAIDGVDVLFVGPADLSHSLGIPGQFDHPDYLAAVERTIAAAEAQGKATGILLRDTASLARHLELGFRFIGIGSDNAFVGDGARAVARSVRS
jgi:4-hydroxy-2-oxoheptanedioate aldolase